MKPSRTILAAIAALVAMVSSCRSPPGRRMAQDSFVVLTAPAQLPVMAARDAVGFHPNPAAKAILFPINFPLYLLEHAVFTVVHLLDMPLAPYHYAVRSEPMDVYGTPAFPMELEESARETLESGIAVGALIVGGVVASVLLASAL